VTGESSEVRARQAAAVRRRQDLEDEPLAAVEAESRGAWIVAEKERPTPGAGRGSASYPERYEVFRSWEDTATDEPTASFRFREQAYLYAAALEVAAGARCSR
jgi:hypothetical protein